MYLLKNWPAACRLEEAMSTIRRDRYTAIIDAAAEMIVSRLGKEKYACEFYPTQIWDDGLILFWIKSWNGGHADKEVPFFCLGGLRLEYLLSDSQKDAAPYGCLYTKSMRKYGLDLGKLKEKIQIAGKAILKSFPPRYDEDEYVPVRYKLPEGRQELKRLLFEDENEFVKVLVEHAVRLADLAPVVTNALAELSLDPKLNNAVEVCLAAGRASTSLLQRKMGFGYTRASKLCDQMESLGIVGPDRGAKGRELLISIEGWNSLKPDLERKGKPC